MQITVDIWVTTIVSDDEFWSVVHHSMDEVAEYLRGNGCHQDHIYALRGNPFIGRHWTGDRDGMAIRCRTESKRVRLEVTLG